MADTLEIEIVTPERLVVKDTAEEVQIPGKNGYLGILPGHAPLISELGVGQISYRKGSVIHYLAVAWGFAEVLPGKLTILAETAELAAEIDVPGAKRAREQAQTRLTAAVSEQESETARNEVAVAESRLLAASSAGLADMANLVP
ncbi:MAG TPA: F0F1 ATP synthase subunit epsilon [Terriglobales bacterium]|jgi:F-type H+-transporting ATPase subunit epsilon|nr:F0F1 ATP synthase subunit epsilon [Terriglobales bacterium]